MKPSCRTSHFGLPCGNLLPAILLGLLLPLASLAQPKTPAPAAPPIPPEAGVKLARELVANLLSQAPSESSSNTAVVKIRGADRKQQVIPAIFEIIATPTNYLNIYRTAGTKLTIAHADGQPNQYCLEAVGSGAPQKLAGAQLMTPFAGSDFWVADLGVEFLHWPGQRVLKKEMRKSQSCYVLESANPQPAPGGYRRVVSWIGINHPDDFVLVHADAYDAEGNWLKEFDPKDIQKVGGVYQLGSMEMRNRQTRTGTIIEFNLSKR